MTHPRKTRSWPYGAPLAAVTAAALCAFAPLVALDREAVLAGRAALVHDGPRVVAVGLTGEDPAAVAALARVGGAAEVVAPSLDPLPPATRAPVARVAARAVIEGRVPPSALAGRVVVIDAPARAEARAAAIAAADATVPGSPAREALVAFAALATLATALVVGRLRPGACAMAIGAFVFVALAVSVGMAASGRVAPIGELGVAVMLAAFGGLADRARRLARLVEALGAPLLRATSRPGAASGVRALVGPALCELLEARGILLLETPPGARRAVVRAGWQMTASDLVPGAALDPRLPPFRDRDGVVRPSPGGSLLAVAAPATLLPLSARGIVEGYLLVVDAGALEAAPEATLAACAALAEELRADRMRATSRRGATLLEAAGRLDDDAATIAGATGQARTGLALITAAGATRWKNERFDLALSDLAPHATGDLARVLSIFHHVGETPLETMQRICAAGGPVRNVIAGRDRGLSATATMTARGLLVEIDVLEAAALDALTPPATAEIRVRATSPMFAVGASGPARS